MEGKNVWDFMNTFIDTPLKEEVVLSKFEQQYINMFGHSVPREMFPPSVTEEQLEAALKKCVELKKDDLFNLLGITLSSDYLY